MVTEDAQLGAAILHLLAQHGCVQVLRELAAGGRRRPRNLERSLPTFSHGALARLLGDLAQVGAVTHDRESGVPPSAWYTLTEAGRELLPIYEAARRWERRWSSLARGGEAGIWTMRLMADAANRTIVLALVDNPLRPIEIDRQFRHLERAGVRRRLRYLLANGVLERTHRGQHVRYKLTTAARRLALITALAARWESEWCERDGTGDVPRLLRLLAPAAQPPAHLSGVCRLHIDTEGSDPTDVYMRAQAGELTALPDAPTNPPHAHGKAAPHVWRGALLDRNPAGIAICGNTALVLGVFMSVSSALLT